MTTVATSAKPSVVFFGNERLATGVTTSAPVLRGLLNAGYPVLAVVSHHTEGTSRKSRDLEVARIAQEHGIPLFLPDKPSEISHELEALHADIGVLAAYGKIVPQSVIDIFPHGIINLHPSLLPQHRGPIPLESVILSGDKQTGVSVMGLVKAMDAGPVFIQETVELTGSESKQALADRLGALGAQLIVGNIDAIYNGELVGQTQVEAKATYDDLITKDAGLIDWTKPAIQIEREIRAYTEWPKSRTNIGSIDVIITSAHAISGNGGQPGEYQILTDEKQLTVNSGQGRLSIDTLKPAGKADMPVAAFLAGYKDRLS